MASKSSDETNESDHSLLKKLRDGQQDAATELFLRYGARLHALANSRTSPTLQSRFDPDDVIQSVFRTFFRRAAKGLYDVPEGEELWQLLLVLSLNKIRDLATHHRAQKRDVGKTAGVESLAEQNREASVEALEIVLDDFLANIPQAQAEVAVLRMEGYEVAEIAEKMGRSKRTIERILNQLRKLMLNKLDFA